MSTDIKEFGPEISEAVRMLGVVHDSDCAMERISDTLILLWEQEVEEGDVVSIARRNVAARCWKDMQEIQKVVGAAHDILRKVGVAVGEFR